jgi:hypothetical protein
MLLQFVQPYAVKASVICPRGPNNPDSNRVKALFGREAFFFLASSTNCDGVVPVHTILLLKLAFMSHAASSTVYQPAILLQ